MWASLIISAIGDKGNLNIRESFDTAIPSGKVAMAQL